jgi:hypothetical protein
MKTPWQLGILGLTLAGVSAYNIRFFQHRTQLQADRQSEIKVATAELNPVLPAAPEGVAAGPEYPAPPISQVSLDRLALQPYVHKDDPGPNPDSAWPGRDPFSIRESEESRRLIAEVQPRRTEISAKVPESPKTETVTAPPAEPQCLFSGTLILDTDRLAMINGSPISVGAQVGAWQLVRIESDYIILESGKETRRIELAGTEPQNARRREPL